MDFSLLCVLATAFLDSFFLSNYLAEKRRKKERLGVESVDGEEMGEKKETQILSSHQ